MVRVTDIIWDTDGETADLPTEVTLEDAGFNGGYDDEIADALSDRYGYCVESLVIRDSNPEIFELFEDMTKVKDSMQFDSETDICRYISPDGEYCVTIEVRGDVRVDWCPEGIESGETVDTYRYPSEFPKELKDLIAANLLWCGDSRVYVQDNNWFEFFIWSHENGDNKYLTSDYAEVEGFDKEQLLDFCREVLRLYLNDVKKEAYMGKFLVESRFLYHAIAEIEADSLEEAKEIADNLDGGDFDREVPNSGDMELYSIVEDGGDTLYLM